MKIGEAIRRIRLRKGVTQIELADRLEMSRSNLCTMELRKNNIRLFTLECIALGLEVKVSEIIIEAEQLSN